MKELTAFLMIIIGIFIYIHFLRNNLFLDKVVSSVNNKEYFVRNLPDKNAAADKLANLGNSLKNLINSLDNNEKIDDINRLKENFDSEHITENIPGSLYVAYSLNKGAELSICIRDKETDKFIDDNTIMFVAIHELAHIMTDETGHTPKFWNNMKYLLLEASSIGIYSPVDYSNNPVMYCGMQIDSSPLNN